MTPSGIEPVTFRLVAQCLNRLRHRVPPERIKADIIKKRSECTGFFTVRFQLKIWLIHETHLYSTPCTRTYFYLFIYYVTAGIAHLI